MKNPKFKMDSLNLKHEVILEEYKIILTYTFGLIGGVTLASAYTTPVWYFYTIGTFFLSLGIWQLIGKPKRVELTNIHSEIEKLTPGAN